MSYPVFIILFVHCGRLRGCRISREETAWGFVTTSEVHVCLHCLVVLRRTVCIMRADEGASRWIGCSLKSLSLRHLRSSTSRSLVDVTVIRKKADLAKQLGATSVHGPSTKAQGEPPAVAILVEPGPKARWHVRG